VQKPQHLVDTALALADGGYIAYLADDREVADPTAGQALQGKLLVRLRAGDYRARFYSPSAGEVASHVTVRGAEAPVQIDLPKFEQDLVVLVDRVPAGANAPTAGSR